VTPRIPLSFPISIIAVFNEEVAQIKVPNDTLVRQVEHTLSVRWGVPVKIAPNEPTVWLPNKRYQFLSVVPGQNSAMTEVMIRQRDLVAPPAEVDLMITVCDGN
jgi:hypothetical protein